MKILVVVDMQKDFIDGALGTKEAQAIVPKVVEKIRNFDGNFVAYTMDFHSDDLYNYTLEGKKLPIKHCICGTEGWELNDEVRKAIFYFQNNHSYKNVCCFEKNTFGCLGLGEYFKKALTEFSEMFSLDFEIEIVGLCTDICVVSNALLLRAFFPNCKIIVDSSCCAGTTPEAHEAALKVMQSCQIDVV